MIAWIFYILFSVISLIMMVTLEELNGRLFWCIIMLITQYGYVLYRRTKHDIDSGKDPF